MNENEPTIVQRILDGIKMPTEVESVDFHFAEDSTGMPAVWIHLHILDDYHPSVAKIDTLRAAKKAISSQLLDSDLRSWPYVRLIAH